MAVGYRISQRSSVPFVTTMDNSRLKSGRASSIFTGCWRSQSASLRAFSGALSPEVNFRTERSRRSMMG